MDRAAGIAPPRTMRSAKETSIRARILIVDDNRNSEKSLAEVLTLSGNKTFVTHDGEESVATAEQQRPYTQLGKPAIKVYPAHYECSLTLWGKKVKGTLDIGR